MPSDFATADTSSYNDPTVNRLLATASNDPQQQIQLMQGQQQIQQNQLKISSDQIALGRQKLAAADEVFGAIGSNPTQANAQARIMEAVRSGAVDYDTAAQGFAQLMPLGDDPKAISGWAFDHMARNATYDQKLQNMEMAAPTLVNTGGQLRPVTQQSGLKPSINDAGGGPLPITTTPGEKMGGITTKGTDGSSIFRPNSTLYDNQGNFLGAGGGGTGSTPTIPVYRGGGSPPPAAPVGQGASSAGPAPSSQGSPPPAALAGQSAGGSAPAPAASVGVQPSASAGGAQNDPTAQASTPSVMVTPTSQTLPVISKQMNDAAVAALQNGQNTPANRNILRGYAVQNNLAQIQHMGDFEPQPAGVGAGVSVPPQPAAGQGAAPAGSGAGAASASTWTPSAATMPVISKADADAATARMQAKQSTPADRNMVRAYLMQNSATQAQPTTAKGMAFEPQPGQPPQDPGQGAAPATPPVFPGRQPPQGTAQPPMQQVPGSDSSLMERAPITPAQQPAPPVGGFGGRYGGQARQGAGLTVGLSPGQEASLKAGSDGYAALSSDVSNPSGVNQRLFQLRTALGALRGTETGLGTAQRQQLVGYLASLPGGLAKWAPGVDPDSATSYDIATKYLNAYALNTPGAARSDAGLSTAQSANANTSGMMQKAAQDVTLSNIGLENGKRALLNSFNTSGADPGTFGKFAAQWMQGADPRAFALPDMTPAERGQLYTGLQGPAKTAFLPTVKKGMAAGILTPNDLQGAAGNGR